MCPNIAYALGLISANTTGMHNNYCKIKKCSYTTFLLFALFYLYSGSAFAAQITLASGQQNLTIWSKAADRSADKVTHTVSNETYTVLGTATIKSTGKKWHHVQFTRGGKVIQGYVEAEYFQPVAKSTSRSGTPKPLNKDRDAKAEAVSSDCLPCAHAETTEPINKRTRTDLRQVADATNTETYIWPAAGPISDRRFGIYPHPKTGKRKMHEGIDVQGPNKTPIGAIGSGTVVESKTGCAVGDDDCGGGWGNYVLIKHSNGQYSRYAHLNGACAIPAIKTRLNRGQQLGCIGKTGVATGPHLHFEILDSNRKPIDPIPLLPPGRV